MNVAKRARLQQESKDTAELLATVRAAKNSEAKKADADASDLVSLPTKKVNMFDEFRNLGDL
jgi:hypothetical protein